jgi:hypothetical protein
MSMKVYHPAVWKQRGTPGGESRLLIERSRSPRRSFARIRAIGLRSRFDYCENEMTELTVKLPDELAQQLRTAGLLENAVLEKLFREALRRQAVGELFAALDEIQALKLPPMTEQEIQAEIDAARAERRAQGR